MRSFHFMLFSELPFNLEVSPVTVGRDIIGMWISIVIVSRDHPALAVALGAFAGPAFKSKASVLRPDMQAYSDAFQVANLSHLIHSTALFTRTLGSVVDLSGVQSTGRCHVSARELCASIHGFKNYRARGHSPATRFSLARTPSNAVGTYPLVKGGGWSWGSGLLLGGMAVFSGSLYAVAVTENPNIGAITPIGQSVRHPQTQVGIVYESER